MNASLRQLGPTFLVMICCSSTLHGSTLPPPGRASRVDVTWASLRAEQG
jgi:hypothetical protein